MLFDHLGISLSLSIQSLLKDLNEYLNTHYIGTHCQIAQKRLNLFLKTEKNRRELANILPQTLENINSGKKPYDLFMGNEVDPLEKNYLFCIQSLLECLFILNHCQSNLNEYLADLTLEKKFFDAFPYQNMIFQHIDTFSKNILPRDLSLILDALDEEDLNDYAKKINAILANLEIFAAKHKTQYVEEKTVQFKLSLNLSKINEHIEQCLTQFKMLNRINKKTFISDSDRLETFKEKLNAFHQTLNQLISAYENKPQQILFEVGKYLNAFYCIQHTITKILKTKYQKQDQRLREKKEHDKNELAILFEKSLNKIKDDCIQKKCLQFFLSILRSPMMTEQYSVQLGQEMKACHALLEEDPIPYQAVKLKLETLKDFDLSLFHLTWLEKLLLLLDQLVQKASGLKLTFFDDSREKSFLIGEYEALFNQCHVNLNEESSQTSQ